MSLLKEINEKLALLSLKLKLAIPINLPVVLMLELTNRCNLKCPLCPTGTGQLKFKKTDMAFQQFKKIIDELRSYIKRIYFEGFGEPLLCGDVFQIIGYSKKLKIKTEMATNGTILNTENVAKKLVLSGLDTIRISLDGATEMTLRKYRIGANIIDILEGIEKLIITKSSIPQRFRK